jgi:hypothetical protein
METSIVSDPRRVQIGRAVGQKNGVAASPRDGDGNAMQCDATRSGLGPTRTTLLDRFGLEPERHGLRLIAFDC